MPLATARWLVPAICAGLALAGLATCLWHLRGLVVARRLTPAAGQVMGSLLVLRLAVMVAAVIATDRFLAGALDRVLPQGDGIGGLAGRWGVQLLLSFATLALWDAGPGPFLRRGVSGATGS